MSRKSLFRFGCICVIIGVVLIAAGIYGINHIPSISEGTYELLPRNDSNVVNPSDQYYPDTITINGTEDTGKLNGKAYITIKIHEYESRAFFYEIQDDTLYLRTINNPIDTGRTYQRET